MKQNNKEEDFQESYFGTLGASLLGKMLAEKGVLKTGYGNKEGKGMLRACYGNKIDFLTPFHPLTNF